MGEQYGVKFNLLDLCSQNIKQILSNVAPNDRVCVVSIIGKSSLNSSEFKASIIDEALGRNVFQSSLGSCKRINTDSHNSIQGFYDPESHTIFLHLSGISDTNYIVQKCKELENELKRKSFLELWTDLQYHYAKALLLLFNVSHIVIVAHPNSSFDLSYIYLFRTLDAIRVKALPWFADQLRGFSISSEWIQAGRPCSPRVLFVFETCPISLTAENNNIASVETSLKFKTKKLPPLKKLEHSVEDQIYRILRKSRVITNISGNSLFAVPPNQEFVFIFSSRPHITDPIGFYMSLLRKHCQMAKEQDTTGVKSKNALNQKLDSHPNNIIGNGLFVESQSENISDHSFGKFLEQHVKLALTKGFDDNVGRYPTPAYFELPTVETWFEITVKLAGGILDEPKDNKMRSVQNALRSALDIDVSFSEGRCAKILNLASSAYQENLPTHYTEEYHQTRLAHALQVFAAHSRGPAYSRFVQKLKEDCERVWKNGHQMCEVLSLTGNHCINPVHRTENEPEDKTLPLLPHCSQVKLVSSCDCGRKQSSREDPFDVKAANYSFYVAQHSHCCGELERIDFPVFQASTAESHPARIAASQASLPMESDEKTKESSPATSSVPSTNGGVKSVLSEGNTEDGSSTSDPEQLATDEQSQSQAEEAREEIVISIQEGIDAEKEKSLVRQPSTTEYLPGMLHSESPPGLLPVFSSWSLVCLGPSSLYSHNIGLQDQPGFLPGTNFLLPWDVTVKVENKDRWPALWEGKRPLGMKAKKAMRDGPQFNVKIFIGVEYECYRGHRFMCSAPDRVLRVTQAGLVKDNASKVTGSDMPLYFPCPCRSAKPQMAQLMRIHVVTPKAPVHVTLNPHVQPAPEPCPLFFPTTNEPLKLSQSAYWVLRLPFVYEGDQGPFLPPREPVPVEMCRLMKGTYNIAEQQSNR